MEDAASAVPPPPLPPTIPAVAAVADRRPLAGFVFDLLLAALLVFGLGIAGVAAWAMAESFRLGLQGRAPAEVAERIGQPGGLALIAISLVSTATAALLLYFWRRRASANERAVSARASRRAGTWGWAAMAGIATFVFSSLATALGQQAGIEQVPSNLPLIEAVGDSHPAVLLAFAVLLAPAYEELLFRRVLFGRLWAAGRPWLGMALSSAAFASMHELPGLGHNDWAASVSLWTCYAAMGAAFAWVYRRTGTLWAAIGAHAINNLLACTLLLGAG
jgi:uncharacterized protein